MIGIGIGLGFSAGRGVASRFTSRAQSIWGALLVGLYLPEDAIFSAGNLVSITPRVGPALSVSGTITSSTIGGRPAIANVRVGGTPGSHLYTSALSVRTFINCAKASKVIADDYQMLLHSTTPAQFLIAQTQGSSALRVTAGVTRYIDGVASDTVPDTNAHVYEAETTAPATAWTWMCLDHQANQAIYNWGSASGALVCLSGTQTAGQRAAGVQLFRDFGYGTP